MYESFFGFQERPFKLVPNPAYLFLSRSHEEALAHLQYAVLQGDGFVEITGEVGTGKTTLCRAFLEGLDERAEVAYIFNPKMTSMQLLRVINEELGINSKPKNIKDLIGILNVFLMEKSAENKRVILLIDEAQSLNREVLEQLRLLSNLETNTNKLLQIILVGQPELEEMLNSTGLRQLRQRITLNCHLAPLSLKETRDYIVHRIRVASRKPRISIDQAGLQHIYRYSRGIPRLINIVCERSLVTAFGMNERHISGNIVKMAVKELAGSHDSGPMHRFERKKAVVAAAFVFLLLFALILFHSGIQLRPLFQDAEIEKPGRFQIERKGTSAALISDKELPAERDDRSEVDQGLEGVLRQMDTLASRHLALKTTMGLWDREFVAVQDLPRTEDSQAYFDLAANGNGFMVQRTGSGLDLLEKLNLPAILELYPLGNHSPRYLALTKMDEKKVTLKGGKDDLLLELTPLELQPHWSGVAYILWRDFLGCKGTIPFDAPNESIVILKMLMHEIGFHGLDINPVYDEQTKEAVKNLQKKHGIGVDGIVGPLTKIILYNEKRSLRIPHIRVH